MSPKVNCSANRCPRPPKRVLQRPIEIRVLAQRSKMVEADEATGKGVQQLDVAEGIGDAEHQRHQHDRDDQNQRRCTVEIGIRRIGHPLE